MFVIKTPKRVNLKGAPTDKYIWYRQDARAYLTYLVLKEMGDEHEGGALGISKKLNLKNKDARVEPASLTKILTSIISYRDWETR